MKRARRTQERRREGQDTLPGRRPPRHGSVDGRRDGRLARLIGGAALAVVALTICSLFPVAHADGGAPNLAYVVGTGADAGNLAIVDLGQKRLAAQVDVGSQPGAVVLSPDARFAYVSQTGSNSIAIVDASRQQVTGTIRVGDGPRGLALDLSLSAPLLYTANSRSNTVSVVDPAAQRQIASIAVGRQPQALAITGTGTGIRDASHPELYVANTGDSTVSVVDLAMRSVVASLAMPVPPVAVTIPSNGMVAYVALQNGSVVAVNLFSRSVLGTVFAQPASALGVMDYDAVTGEIYVPDAARSCVYVLSPVGGGVVAQQHLVRTLSVSGAPDAVAVTYDGSFLLVAQASVGHLAFYDAATNALLASFELGGTPRSVITGAYPPSSSSVDVITVGALLLIVGAIVALVVVAIRIRRGRTLPPGGAVSTQVGAHGDG